MTRPSPFIRDLLDPDPVSPALAKSIAETQAASRAAFRRRLAKESLTMSAVQPSPTRHACHFCPACGCTDVVITGHEMSCKRCGTTTDLSQEAKAR